MRAFFMILLIGAGLLLVLGIGSGLLALMAYGLGYLLNMVMKLEPFQATVIALASLCIFGIFADRLWNAILSAPPFDRNDEDDEFEDEFFDEYEDDEEDEEEEPVIYSGIPRWRQPLKNPDFSNAKPDDRCPCGSGKKYKNCHGIKKKAN